MLVLSDMMAADTGGSQTEYLIEVSQDSPITKQQSVAQDEVVEDSLKDIPEAYRGGAVKAPQVLFFDDEDDLYSESPKAKARRLSRNSVSNSAKAAEVGPSTTTARQERPASDNRTDKQVRASKRQSQTPWQPRTALEGDQRDELAADDDGPTAPIGSHAKSSQRQQKRGTKDTVAQTPNMSNATTAANGSARAALLARRQAQDGRTDGISGSRALADRKAPTTSKEDPKTSHKDLRTPAPQPSTNAAVETRPKSGKLTARKGGTSKSTPRVSHASEGVAGNGDDSDGTDELTKNPGPAYRSEGPSAKKGALKTPARRGLQRAARKKSSYDVEESPESQESNEETHETKVSKPTTTRWRQRGSAAKAADQPTTSKAAQRARPNRTAARRQDDERQQSPKKISARSRMKAESNANGIELPASSAKSTTKATSTAKGRQKQPDATPRTTKRAKNPPKPVDRDEDPVIRYDDNEDRCDDDASQDDSEDLSLVKREKRLDGNPAIQDGDFNEGTARPANSETLTRRQRRPSVQQRTNRASGSVIRNQRHETPTVPGSSPPPLTAPSMANVMKKKPAFIAFDKSGPQNQGTFSTKDGAPTSTRTSRSSTPAPPAFTQPNSNVLNRSEQRAERQPLASGASTESQQTNQRPPRTNVAKDAEHALTNLANRKSSTQAQVALVLSSPTENIPQDRHRDEPFTHPVAEDDDFMLIDDFDSPTMLVEEETVAAKPQSRLVTERTRSQIQMPPPPAPRSSKVKPPTSAPNAAPNMGFDFGANAKESATSEAKPAAKRAHDENTTLEPASKRPRALTMPPSGSQRLTKELRSTSMVFDERRKPEFPQQAGMPVPELEKRQSRKPSRQQSRGSQTVDMQGSPIPEGMTVQEKATALETYSQQAGLQSDGMLDDEIITVTASNKRIKLSATSQEFVPPSHQREPMSSNKKKKPTGPEEKSRGIERVVRADHHLPLVEDEAGSPSTDPFTSADENRKQPREGSTSSELLMRFEHQMYHEVINQIQQHPSTPRIPEEVFASIRKEPVRHQFQKATVAAGRQQPRQQDPEKTLVEEEPQRRGHKRKRAPSISTTSSDSSDSAPGTPTSVHDVGAWRNALQPHQMNVFDGLVIVSHKLVRHLVDAETAAKDIKDDYRRRAMNIIEQMELSHAEAYKKLQNSIKSTKKELHREYIDCAEKLEEQVAAIRAAQHERKEMWAKDKNTVETLQEFMAEVC